jgi:integral membrane protein
MNYYFNSKIGRLRLLAIFEGISLLVLVFISIPLKHIYEITTLSSTLGPIHGILFLLFVINTISVGIEYNWKFKKTTWKVLVACVIPFGTFYIDHKILKPIHKRNI